MELLLFIIYLMVGFGLALKRKPLEGYFSVFFVFGLAGFAYFTLIPFEMYMKGEEFYFVHSWIKLGPSERRLILLLSVISLFGFYFGLKTSRFRLFPLKSNWQYINRRLHSTHFSLAIEILLSVIVLCIAAILMLYGDIFIQQYDYRTAYGITYRSPLYSFLKMHLLIALALMAGIIMHMGSVWWRKIICSIIVIFILSVGMLTADKNPLLIALLTCASFLRWWRISLKRFFAIVLVSSICVIILSSLFNVYRTRVPVADVMKSFSWRSISFTHLDPAGPMVSLVNVISDDSLEFEYGSTLINSLGVLIPKLLWPGRPLDLSEKFARENIADWSGGQGMGYSPLAEAFVNFNMPGAFVQFFVFGLLVGGFLQFVRKRISYQYEFLLFPFIYILVYYTVILSFRSPLIGPIKMIIMFMIPYCIAFGLLRAVRRMLGAKKIPV